MGLFSSKSKTKSKTELSKDSKEYLYPMLDKGKELMKSGSPSYYNFDTVAGLDPYQQQGIDALGNNQMGGSIANQMFNSGMAGNDILSQYYGNPVNAPQVTNEAIGNFYNSDLVNQQVGAATDSASQFLDRYLGNDIASGAAATGNTGSSRRGMLEGQAIGNTATGLANTVAGINQNAYGNAMNLATNNANMQGSNNQLNANNMGTYANYTGNNLGNAFNFNNTNANNMINAGSLNQVQNQNEINAQKEGYMWDYNQDWNGLQQYMGLASPMYGMTNTNTTSTSSPSIAGMAAQLGSAYLMSGGDDGSTAGKVGGVSASQPLNLGDMSFSGFSASQPLNLW